MSCYSLAVDAKLRKKPGRKSLPLDQRRTDSIQVRINQHERKLLEAQAHKADMKVSDYIRERAGLA